MFKEQFVDRNHNKKKGDIKNSYALNPSLRQCKLSE